MTDTPFVRNFMIALGGFLLGSGLIRTINNDIPLFALLQIVVGTLSIAMYRIKDDDDD